MIINTLPTNYGKYGLSLYSNNHHTSSSTFDTATAACRPNPQPARMPVSFNCEICHDMGSSSYSCNSCDIHGRSTCWECAGTGTQWHPVWCHSCDENCALCPEFGGEGWCLVPTSCRECEGLGTIYCFKCGGLRLVSGPCPHC